MLEIKPPSPERPAGFKVFAAGSIEMGAAVEWQQVLKERLADLPNVVIYNPRRDDWDATWGQTLEDGNFVGQVNWEVDHIDESDVVFIYIDPNTKSIITYGEMCYLFGQIVAGKHRNVVIACPQGYWRRGNVQVMCQRVGIKLHETLDEGIEVLRGFCSIGS